MSREVELLWFKGCANHPAARRMLEEVVAEVAPGTLIRGVDASDPAAAERLRFPGSPTIRVDGRDVDPTYADPGDYTPRCRLYRTDAGLQGLPERGWIVDALRVSRSRSNGNAGTATLLVDMQAAASRKLRPVPPAPAVRRCPPRYDHHGTVRLADDVAWRLPANVCTGCPRSPVHARGTIAQDRFRGRSVAADLRRTREWPDG